MSPLSLILEKLKKNFTEWSAFKLGLINEKGDIVRDIGKDEQGKDIFLLPSEEQKQRDALSDENKILIKMKKYLGETNLEKLDLYIQILEEKEAKTIRSKELLSEKVNQKKLLEEVDFEIEVILSRHGISREDYYNYILKR